MKRHASMEEWAQSPEEQLLKREQEREAWEALHGLPMQWKEICLLRWVRGWTKQETAGALGITREAVARTENRARKELKRALRKPPDFMPTKDAA